MATLSLAFEVPALRAALYVGPSNNWVELSHDEGYIMALQTQALISSKAGRAAKV